MQYVGSSTSRPVDQFNMNRIRNLLSAEFSTLCLRIKYFIYELTYPILPVAATNKENFKHTV